MRAHDCETLGKGGYRHKKQEPTQTRQRVHVLESVPSLGGPQAVAPIMYKARVAYRYFDGAAESIRAMFAPVWLEWIVSDLFT